MFVLKSTYDRSLAQYSMLFAQYVKLNTAYSQLLESWNTVATKINDKGGQNFLDGKTQPAQFTKDEVIDLIRLCHPDKHGNSAKANEITAKLLELRRKL